MLRESVTENGLDYDVTAVTGKRRGDEGLAHAQLLCDFAEAVVSRDQSAIASCRDRIIKEMGVEAFVDAAATSAAFHGNVRVADATGIPPEKAAAGRVTDDFRAELGIDQFYKAQNSG